MTVMVKFKSTITLSLIAILASAPGLFVPAFSSENNSKPADADQKAAKTTERPSHAKQAHKALKSMDTKIPAETSKAVRSLKEGFKKRFRTTQEGGKNQK